MTYKKLLRDSRGLAQASLVGGFGADLVLKSGGNPAALDAYSQHIPSIASALGAKATVDTLHSLSRKKRR